MSASSSRDHRLDPPLGLKVATLGNTAVHVHWSALYSGLVPSALTGFNLASSLGFFLACFALIALHEFSHFATARAMGLSVYSIELSGFGGLCRVQPPRKTRDTLLVFSAGLLTQLVLLVMTWLMVERWGWPPSPFAKAVALTFTVVNAIYLFINLIPFRTLNGHSTDGKVLWGLFLHVTQGRPHPLHDMIYGPVFPPGTRLLSVRELVPPFFTTGVEILNDEKTPMEFVIKVLTEHLGLDQEAAVHLMLKIHLRGGQLVPTPDLAQAEATAAAINADAQREGHPFVCRAVDAKSEARAYLTRSPH